MNPLLGQKVKFKSKDCHIVEIDPMYNNYLILNSLGDLNWAKQNQIKILDEKAVVSFREFKDIELFRQSSPYCFDKVTNTLVISRMINENPQDDVEFLLNNTLDVFATQKANVLKWLGVFGKVFLLIFLPTGLVYGINSIIPSLISSIAITTLIYFERKKYV